MSYHNMIMEKLGDFGLESLKLGIYETRLYIPGSTVCQYQVETIRQRRENIRRSLNQELYELCEKAQKYDQLKGEK